MTKGAKINTATRIVFPGIAVKYKCKEKKYLSGRVFAAKEISQIKLGPKPHGNFVFFRGPRAPCQGDQGENFENIPKFSDRNELHIPNAKNGNIPTTRSKI